MSELSLINTESVILVSGGARGITARCVVKLAEKAHCKFILLGRSSAAMPDLHFDPHGMDDTALKKAIAADLTAQGEKALPARIQKLFAAVRSSEEIQNTLEAVRRAGGQVEYLAADVTNGDDVRAKVGQAVQHVGAVTGIIHGAGALVDKLIEKKLESDFETVMAPKVNGLENLLSCVEMPQLKFLVLFSSIVGFFGNVGQADYAIANEILNKSAYMLQHKYPNCHVISINWGPWDAGMVTPELKKVFEARHVEVIPSEAGAQLLVDALSNGAAGVQVVVGGVPVQPAAQVSDGLKLHEIQRRLRVDENPFLFDHQIGDHPVLPATCAASWIAYSCEQLYPGFHFSDIENYRVLKGIVFDEHLPTEHTLELKEVVKSEERIVFDALISSKNEKGRTQFHYSLRCTLLKTLPDAPIFEVGENTLPAGNPILGSVMYKDGTLFHGPSFQGVEEVLHISRGKLVMRCTLPHVADRIQGQFPAYTSNPFIYDAIVQCLLIWAQYFYDAPCLPSSLRKLQQYRSISFDTAFTVTMQVESQTDTSVVGNIDVTDAAGRTYVHIEGLEGTISPYLKRLIGERAPGAARWVAEG